jgi:uncharacterized protein (DUF2235 family)
MPKNLVLCCDGTWDSADQAADPKTGELCVSNVLKIAVRLKKVTSAGKLQIVYYDQGVGTGNVLDKIGGGAFGDGLEANINDVYRFLIANYEPGDAIYLFGFSRGAYTARSIAGMIRRCGIITRENVRKYPDAKALYRSGVNSGDPKAVQFRKDFAIEDSTPVQCIGVWDTVGALGIPVHGFSSFNESKYGFLDTTLSSAVKFAFHALSVDERRGPFKPTLWDSAPAAGQTVQQAWFAGVHSDIGGGYPEHGLSDLALEWMLDCAALAGAEPDPAVVGALGAKPDAKQTPHNSLKGLFRVNTFDRQVGATKTESFHRSLVEKWRDGNADGSKYRPKPLQAHAARLDALAAGALNDVLYPV